MQKSENALKTIGEMSKALGVQPHILRYWEEQFSILNPLKRAGGRRYYRSEDAALLRQIHHLIYDEGFTIKGAQKYIRDAKKASTPKIEKPTTENSTSANHGHISADVRRELENIADGLRKALAV